MRQLLLNSVTLNVVYTMLVDAIQFYMQLNGFENFFDEFFLKNLEKNQKIWKKSVAKNIF